MPEPEDLLEDPLKLPTPISESPYTSSGIILNDYFKGSVNKQSKIK